MNNSILPPAPNPCGSCPYRCDVPSGIWDKSEYQKLPAYDNETCAQPTTVFLCHQQNGRLCGGWVAVHDMDESLGLRIAIATGRIDRKDIAALQNYRPDVAVFASGKEAAKHGLREVRSPGVKAISAIAALKKRRASA